MIRTADRIANVEEYYFSKKLTEVRGLDTPEWRVINLGIGSPDLAPASSTIEALAACAHDSTSHGYQSYKGIPALRVAISEFYQRVYGVKINPETELLPLMGSKEGIMHISMAFLNPGDEVLIPDPGYPTYSSVAKLAGASIRTYHMREELSWGIDIDALEQSDLSMVKLMWINFPHMPTGRVATRNELNRLISLARKNQFLIVNDNPYSLILNDSPLSILSIAGADEVALELNSLSKSHNMAGWRIGWVAGRQDFLDAVLKVKSNMDSGMFLGLQKAAVEALKSDHGWFEALNSIYELRRRAAKEILDALNCTYSSHQSGLFVWAKVSEEIIDVEKWIDKILYGTRVFITPGFIFGDNGKRYIRISLCATEEKLREALERIKIFVATEKQTISALAK